MPQIRYAVTASRFRRTKGTDMSFCLPCKLARRPLLYTLSLLFLCLAIGSSFLLQDYHQTLVQERRERTRKMVETAYSLIIYYQEKADHGEITPDKAQRYALETIRQAMPEPNSYFWIIDTQHKGVMHPLRPKWEGTDLTNYTGPDGKKLFVDMVQMAEDKGSGFIDYLWTKPYMPDDKYYQKTSFLKLYQPWEWIVGTGVYVDDIDATFWNAVFVACGLIIAILMFVMALGMTVSESFKKDSN